MTIRQPTQRKFSDDLFRGTKRQASRLQDRPWEKIDMEFALEGRTEPLPTRPDDTILSDAIPLFFIGCNRNGFWVAREAAGRCGGLFFFKRSAARFARRNGLVGVGATMFVEHPIELDLPNRGSRLVELITTTIDIVRRRAPLAPNLIGVAITEWRKLDSQISRAFASQSPPQSRRNDLFDGAYKLASKNDDDLPISRQAK